MFTIQYSILYNVPNRFVIRHTASKKITLFNHYKHLSLSRMGKFYPSFQMPTSVFLTELCRITKMYTFVLKRSHCLSSRLPKIRPPSDIGYYNNVKYYTKY